jgi:hypothetical protein
VSDKASRLSGKGQMETDNVTSLQQLIEINLPDCHVNGIQLTRFETEYVTTKDVPQASYLQTDMTTSNNP